VKVRALDLSDLNPLLDLYHHLNPNDLPLPGRATVEAVWSEALANPRMRHFGAYDGEVLVAACTICVIPNLTRGCKPYALIENVVTAATHRRRGFGKAVLEAALSFAWSQNCYKAMLLSGRSEEGVLRFYRAVGFIPDEKRGFIARPVA
jgi:GNAT superfamily N-acetyltransferase